MKKSNKKKDISSWKNKFPIFVFLLTKNKIGNLFFPWMNPIFYPMKCPPPNARVGPIERFDFAFELQLNCV